MNSTASTDAPCTVRTLVPGSIFTSFSKATALYTSRPRSTRGFCNNITRIPGGGFVV